MNSAALTTKFSYNKLTYEVPNRDGEPGEGLNVKININK
jgi:hypothetical protein